MDLLCVTGGLAVSGTLVDLRCVTSDIKSAGGVGRSEGDEVSVPFTLEGVLILSVYCSLHVRAFDCLSVDGSSTLFLLCCCIEFKPCLILYGSLPQAIFLIGVVRKRFQHPVWSNEWWLQL